MPKSYVPDLKGYIGQCELNYLRLCKLLPQLGEQDERVFGVEQGSEGLRKVRCKVLERCKYTTTVELHAEASSAENNAADDVDAAQDKRDWLPQPSMKVRLYHDAQMAEVLAFNSHHRLQPSYEYPNRRMYQRDEKAQNNLFLGEWLQFCLNHGQELLNPSRFAGSMAETGR